MVHRLLGLPNEMPPYRSFVFDQPSALCMEASSHPEYLGLAVLKIKSLFY